eukprot:403350411
MWTFIFYCSIFAGGMLSVFIDWEFFITELINIKNIENSSKILGVIAVCIVSFVFFMLLPAQMLYNFFENSRMGIYEQAGLRKISARQQWKRRSSWPLAYSNIMMTEKDQ